MLIKFKTSNYLSFKGEVEFCLSASAIKEYADLNVFEPAPLFFDTKLLKSAILYGANAAGKSNLIKAVEFMKNFVLNSAKELQVNDRIQVESFKLNTQTAKRPSSFEVDFIQDSKRYKYGFNVDKERVSKEYLFEIRRGKELMLFQRAYNEFIIGDNFIEAKDLEKKTRQNALFLSIIAQFNGAISTRIVRWFQGIIFLNDINFRSYFNHSVSILSDEKRRGQMLKILRIANLGFEDVIIRKFKITEELLSQVPDELRKILLSNSGGPEQVLTLHKRFDQNNHPVGQVEFNLAEEESLGTQKYFSFAGHVLDTLTQGGILFIDELDARLHPHLSLLIVQFFNSIKDNPFNSQLVFSTHNTNLLSEKILRRDQVYFVDKDEFGSSKLYTLMDRKARGDASFEKDYLNGEYEAIPFSAEKIKQLNLFDDSANPTLF
ncbi:MAG: AAA family ATPase [Bacteroidota bacterium]